MGDAESGAAIEALYLRERARIFAICMTMLGDPGDAEDATQEAFARVAARIDALHEQPVGYLVAVARNVCRDELRRRGQNLRVESPLARAPGAPPAEDVALDRQLLATAWETLADVDRELIAGAVSGFSLAEIARAAGMRVDAVAQRISRARRRLRGLIGAPAAVAVPLLARAAGRVVRRLHVMPAGQGGTLARLRELEPLGAPVLIALLAGGLAAPPRLGVAPPPVAAAVSAPPARAAVTGAAGPGVVGRSLSAVGGVASDVTGHPGAAPSPPRLTPPPLPPPLASMTVGSFATSPGYGGDQTVFAAGTCGTTGCSRLASSEDGGHTWQQLGGAGLPPYSRILVPSAYPRRPVLFAIAPGSALLRSGDGGASFAPVTVATRGDAAIDPGSAADAPAVYLVSTTGQTLLRYTDADGKLASESSQPLGVEAVTALFTGPGASRVYVGMTLAVGSSGLYACGGGADCARVGPGVSGIPQVSPTFGTDLTYFTLTSGGVRVSRVDGSGVQSMSTGSASTVVLLAAADFATSRLLDIVVRRTAQPDSLLRIVHYVVGGTAPPDQPTGWSTAMDFGTAVRLPDGAVLVARSGGGIACSHDDGASFALSC